MDAPTDGATRAASLSLTALTCAFGVRRVLRRVRAIAGVTVARVNLAHRSVTVAYDPTRVRLDDLHAAIVLRRTVPDKRPAAAAAAEFEQYYGRVLRTGAGSEGLPSVREARWDLEQARRQRTTYPWL